MWFASLTAHWASCRPHFGSQTNSYRRECARPTRRSLRIPFEFCVAVLVALDLSGTAVVRAQAAGGASPAGSDKSDVVDVWQAIVSTAEGKQASAELQSQFAARKNELEALSKQIATDRLAGAQMLSEDERASLERQGQHLTTQYDRKSADSNEDWQAAQNDAVETHRTQN